VSKNNNQNLIIEGARENNLKAVSLEIPHDQLTVVTGLSGSGKSSLAFDTVYAEGQRRYIETFSPYTRQFFDKVKKPDADGFQNVRPAIAIQQRNRITNSRSTVGSLTNLNDYLKLIWFNFATPSCQKCGIDLKAWNSSEVSSWILKRQEVNSKGQILISVSIEELGSENSTISKKPPLKKNAGLKGKKLKSKPTIQAGLKEALLSAGYSRFFDQHSDKISSIESLETVPSKLLLVLDRLRFEALPKSKEINDSVSQAFNLQIPNLPSRYLITSGCALIESLPVSNKYKALYIIPQRQNSDLIQNLRQHTFQIHEFFSEPRCPDNFCKLPKIKQSLFSFNHPLGACPSCKGFGHILQLDLNKVIPNPNLSLAQSAITCWKGEGTKLEFKELKEFCKQEDIDFDSPWNKLPQEHKDKILNSKTKDFWGLYPWFSWLEKKAYKMHIRVLLSRYRSQFVCQECQGSRLTQAALAYKVLGKTLPDIWHMPISDVLKFLDFLLAQSPKTSSALLEVFSALKSRLAYLVELGLPYLTLDRQARTLSGGETQRVNLAAALGSDLVSTQFVLDEPSVGLHPRDTERLLKAIKNLSSKGNSVLMVEHDLDCISSADNIIEIGPKAGSEGGEIVFNGESSEWKGILIGTNPQGNLLSKSATKKSNTALKVYNARARNLKGFDLELPLNQILCLSGPSGSGKSSLIQEVILKAYNNHCNKIESSDLRVDGFEHLDKILLIDQAPLTKSPRANIATYSGMWDRIRDLLAATEDAAARALDKSSFSFNVDAGRCPDCKGAGFIKEDMQFLSDIYVPCESCLGQRFKALVLEVKLKEKSVSEILKLSIDQALTLFKDEPDITDACRTLSLLGLGHLCLGHSLSELSGGEAQRLKLVPYVSAANSASKKSVSKNSKGSLLIFDEPTTGLHFQDTQRLIELLKVLKNNGNSIICVEHNLLLLANADYLIDLGPEGGELGGKIIFQGHPSEFLSKTAQKESETARYLSLYAKEVKGKDRLLSNKDSKTRIKQEVADSLIIRGAREHNLKNIDLKVPFNKLVAFCGVSGSGKSSIAKDIIYAEGQRRYLDCLSPYARQFIKELKKPELDEIQNIKPTVCVYQHTFQPSRLSTVGTMSEIYNFLRLLFCKVAQQYCHEHSDQLITSLSASDMAREIKGLKDSAVKLLVPIVKHKKGSHREVFQRAQELEISQLRVDGLFLSLNDIDSEMGLAKSKVHSIEYVLAKFNPKNIPLDLLEETLAQALIMGSGNFIVHSSTEERVFSNSRSCPKCKKGFFKPDPEDLSFNSKRGRCLSCNGSGHSNSGAICKDCSGARINAIGLSLKIENLSIDKVSNFNPRELIEFLKNLNFSAPAYKQLAAPILREIFLKGQMLISIGLDYIPLSRDCYSLSTGELQRLRLASAASSSLSGAMFIFDEPSAGLHPLDNRKVLTCLRSLQEHGNSVLIIEHDQDSIYACDHVIEVGPGGGRSGGQIIFSDSINKFINDPFSPTSKSFKQSAFNLKSEIKKSSDFLKVKNICVNNITKLSLNVPLKSLVSIAGVSGSGKSSLLRSAILQTLLTEAKKPNYFKTVQAEIESDLEIHKIIEVDQSPIGINSRSTPASYLKIWDDIRSLLSKSIEAEVRGWSNSFFSYNSGKGRCSTCQGLGLRKLEMSFLPDAKVECESCEGKRFSAEALSVKYLGLDASQILDLSFEEAKEIFRNHPKLYRICHLACELGLGYLRLGQSSNTLSGGESQRIKLISELNAPVRGHCIYILDEPSTGLHKSDVFKLIKTLRQLVDRGHSVFLIEHEPDLILASDAVIEMGPGAAKDGGKVVFQGVPKLLYSAKSAWGSFLSEFKTDQAGANFSN
jgi:excinuclease ABC subunit A